MLKSALSFSQWYYEVAIAPWIAGNLRWLLWPLYFVCKKLRICFVVNIVSTTGHIIAELDYFFRTRFLKEIDPNLRYVWLKKVDPYATTCMKLYGNQFWRVFSNRWLYLLSLPLTMAFPEIAYDAGVSRLKWQLPKTKKFKGFEKGSTYIRQVSKYEGIQIIVDYYRKIGRSRNFFPLRNGDFKDRRLLEQLGIEGKKIALIHLKDVARNCTALRFDPASYLPSLEYLKEKGYCLVLVGREKMSPLFEKYEVINYAGSPFASFYHDLLLFHLADLALLTGSGISVLADSMNIHYLYLNSWHLSVPSFSKKSIFVPTIVQDLSGKWLSFSEQNRLYQELVDEGPENFPHGEYLPRNATGEEILMATKELLALKRWGTPLTELQKKFQSLDEEIPLFYVESRCSQFFLEQHGALLKETS